MQLTSSTLTPDSTTQTNGRQASSLDSGPGTRPSFQAGRPVHSETGRIDEASARRILKAADDILAQGASLLRSVTATQYSHKVSAVFGASMGGHYRHCLDHFISLIRQSETNEVDYDHRQRELALETQPEIALVRTERLRIELQHLDGDRLGRPVRARCEVSYLKGQSPVSQSSLGRELVYCIAHAIHHYALISVIARLAGIELPAHFGVAPSTVAHQAQLRPDGK